jgi:hypothetical protein
MICWTAARLWRFEWHAAEPTHFYAAVVGFAGSPLTLSDQLVAAVGASCAVSLVATPTELMKCRLQAQGCSATARQRLIDAGLDPSKHTIYRGPRGVQASQQSCLQQPCWAPCMHLVMGCSACAGLTESARHTSAACAYLRALRCVQHDLSLCRCRAPCVAA